MTDPFRSSLRMASSGLAAQSMRLQVVAENIANANSTSTVPGGDPYRRKSLSFEQTVGEDDVSSGGVRVAALSSDRRPFRKELNVSHPSADSQGYVKLPNVDPLIELADMREANRSYQANLQVVRQSRDLIMMTIDLLKVGT